MFHPVSIHQWKKALLIQTGIFVEDLAWTRLQSDHQGTRGCPMAFKIAMVLRTSNARLGQQKDGYRWTRIDLTMKSKGLLQLGEITLRARPMDMPEGSQKPPYRVDLPILILPVDQ